MPGITLLGLGPGSSGLLTRQAIEIIENAAEIFLRTRNHPVVASFPASLVVHSFDDIYEHGDTFEQVYERIVVGILELGNRPEGVIYAVPGHPFVAEATSPEIFRRAMALGIPVTVVEGISFLEPVLTALGLDPFPQVTIMDGLELGMAHYPPFPTSVPALVAQVYSRQVAADVKLSLMAVYPDKHAVRLVHAAGTPDASVENLALFEIDRSERIGFLTSLYVPPLGLTTSIEAFQGIVAHLRAPDGCPWDRNQTPQSLRPHLLEETYEVLEALDAGDSDALREELGDLLLLVLMLSQISSEYGDFTFAEVLHGIYTKIVARHPHVFGDLDIPDEAGVLLNWEKLKASERKANGQQEKGLLDGVSNTLPALQRAQEYQDRAKRVGFDWPDLSGVWAKVQEELNEVRAAVTQDERASELGDLLFAIVNLARHFGVDSEISLRQANDRFRSRFSYIEREVKSQGRNLADLSLETLDGLWEQAKKQEK